MSDTSSDPALPQKIIFRKEIEGTCQQSLPLEKCPLSSPLQPYWQLRILRNTMVNGGYITPEIFVSKSVWYQSGMKLHGISFQVSAFQQLNSLISARIMPLKLECTTDYLKFVLSVFIGFSNEIINIQNNLSKPFTFIHMIELPEDTSKNASQVKNSINNIYMILFLILQMFKFTSMVTSLTKNVKRYAEVGYQRLGSSLPLAVTDHDIMHFIQISFELCTSCQVVLYVFSLKLISTNLLIISCIL